RPVTMTTGTLRTPMERLTGRKVPGGRRRRASQARARPANCAQSPRATRAARIGSVRVGATPAIADLLTRTRTTPLYAPGTDRRAAVGGRAESPRRAPRGRPAGR